MKLAVLIIAVVAGLSLAYVLLISLLDLGISTLSDLSEHEPTKAAHFTETASKRED
jgi:hypothetical protein